VGHLGAHGLKGDDCVPESTSAVSGSTKGPDETDSAKGTTSHGDAPSSSSPPAASPEGGGSYDKDAVDAQLKRAAKQVKNNCGSASDEEGAQSGPWGATTATLVLGRNGHVADVAIPAPYSGKPVGDCVVNSFKKIQFPPYAGSSDASVTWDVEIVKPKK